MPGLKDLLVEEMDDLLHAENQLIKALPKMAKAAHEPKLRQAFEAHLKETQGHVERLKQGFELLEKKPQAKVCAGMKGLVEEGQDRITEGKEKEEVLSDLAIAAAAQKVEHYEISAYGTVRTMAEKLGQSKLATLFAQTLKEEVKADELPNSVVGPDPGSCGGKFWVKGRRNQGPSARRRTRTLSRRRSIVIERKFDQLAPDF